MQVHAAQTASVALTAGFMRSLQIVLSMRSLRIALAMRITQILRLAMVTKIAKVTEII